MYSIFNLSDSIVLSSIILPLITGAFLPSTNFFCVVNILASSHSPKSIKDCIVVVPPSIITDWILSLYRKCKILVISLLKSFDYNLSFYRNKNGVSNHIFDLN